jgi:hypothetical protein
MVRLGMFCEMLMEMKEKGERHRGGAMFGPLDDLTAFKFSFGETSLLR